MRCSAKSSAAQRQVPAGRAGCSIRSTGRRTSRTGCRSSARRWRSRSTARRRSRPSTTRSRQELFTAERGGGRIPERPADARLAAATLVDALLVTGFPVRRPDRASTRSSACSASSSAGRGPCVAWARRRSTSATSPPGASTDSGRRDLKPWDIAGGALLVTEAGGRVTTLRRRDRSARAAARCSPPTPHLHAEMLDVIASFAAPVVTPVRSPYDRSETFARPPRP